MKSLRLSQADKNAPDMTGWSEWRKANYEKGQRLLRMRYRNNPLPQSMLDELRVELYTEDASK